MKNTADGEYKRILVEDMQNSREKLLIRKKRLKNYDMHWHDCFEIELILSNTATQVLNGRQYALSPGDIYLLNPTDFHSVQSNGAEVYNIMFSENLLDDKLLEIILSVGKNMIFHLEKDEFRYAESIMRQMYAEFENKKPMSDVYIKNLLECLFIILLRKCSFKSAPDADEKTAGVRRALLYLHGHFRDNPSMLDAAKVAGFSANYFSGLFHSVTGMTYKKYLNRLKLEYAKKLILSGNMSMTEICFASGFNSPANFLRLFGNTYGMSPRTMRRRGENAHTAAEDE